MVCPSFNKRREYLTFAEHDEARTRSNIFARETTRGWLTRGRRPCYIHNSSCHVVGRGAARAIKRFRFACRRTRLQAQQLRRNHRRARGPSKRNCEPLRDSPGDSLSRFLSLSRPLFLPTAAFATARNFRHDSPISPSGIAGRLPSPANSEQTPLHLRLHQRALQLHPRAVDDALASATAKVAAIATFQIITCPRDPECSLATRALVASGTRATYYYYYCYYHYYHCHYYYYHDDEH